MNGVDYFVCGPIRCEISLSGLAEIFVIGVEWAYVVVVTSLFVVAIFEFNYDGMMR